MKLKETEYKKLASFAILHDDGYLLQKSCLVDLTNGAVEIGDIKVKRSHYDPNSPIKNTEIHYRGKEFELEKNDEGYRVKNIGGFIIESMRPETITESKLKNISPDKAAWKPK